MYKNILAPIAFDHTERIGPAIAAAKHLASPGATITLLHVMEELPAYVTSQIPDEVLANTRDTTKEELLAVAKSSGVDPICKLVHGHSSRTILDYAEENGIDCIVIASHRPGFEDYFLGSTAAHVVRHAKCAVHVLR